MWRRVATLGLCALVESVPASAQHGEASIALFGSGVARRGRTETSIRGDKRVASLKGAIGLAMERRLLPSLAIELSAEQRRDVVSVRAGGRLCGPFHNTCFDTHRLAISSHPVAVLGRYAYRPGARLSPFASLGVRFVGTPSVRDLTPERLVPRAYFGLPVNQRVSAEIGAGAAWRASDRLSLFAEARWPAGGGSPWDPKLRGNFGLRMSWPLRTPSA
jgi:hypothetical protein